MALQRLDARPLVLRKPSIASRARASTAAIRARAPACPTPPTSPSKWLDGTVFLWPRQHRRRHRLRGRAGGPGGDPSAQGAAMSERIDIAMSGGVDSTAACADHLLFPGAHGLVRFRFLVVAPEAAVGGRVARRPAPGLARIYRRRPPRLRWSATWPTARRNGRRRARSTHGWPRSREPVHNRFDGGISGARPPSSPRRHAIACAWTGRGDRLIRAAKSLTGPEAQSAPWRPHLGRLDQFTQSSPPPGFCGGGRAGRS